MTGGRQKRPKVQLKNWHLAHGTFQSPERKNKSRKLILVVLLSEVVFASFFFQYTLSFEIFDGGNMALSVKIGTGSILYNKR